MATMSSVMWYRRSGVGSGSYFYTDISKKEQLTICIRLVHIDAETTVPAIKDVLSKLQLSLVNCWEQCYDGASNIMGHKHGVVKESRTSNQRLILHTVMDTHSA